MVYAVPHDVIESLEKAARDCLAGKRMGVIAAFSSGPTESSRCPAPLMPAWLEVLVAALDAGIADANAYDFLCSLTRAARQWQVLDEAAWQRVFVFFLAACIETARQIAAPLQATATEIYWAEACDACEKVFAALRGEISMAEANRVAEAAAWA